MEHLLQPFPVHAHGPELWRSPHIQVQRLRVRGLLEVARRLACDLADFGVHQPDFQPPGLEAC